MNLLAAIPYAALRVDRAVRAVLRGFGGALLVAALLVVGASIPLAIEGSRQQPIAESVDGLRDGVSSLSSWVRMRGRIVTLTSPESVAGGHQVQSLLIEPSGDAILMTSHRPLDHLGEVTGRISNSANADEVARRIAGPRLPDRELEIIDRYVLTVDDPIVPDQGRDWTLVWAMLGAGGVLIAGRLAGYPLISMRLAPGSASARPLRVGESLGLRIVEPQDETGTRLGAPRGTLRRLERRKDDDPYFALDVEGRARPLLFRRHRWSNSTAGRLWMVADGAPIVQLRDWGIEVMLALDSEADQERVLASFRVEPAPGAP